MAAALTTTKGNKTGVNRVPSSGSGRIDLIREGAPCAADEGASLDVGGVAGGERRIASWVPLKSELRV